MALATQCPHCHTTFRVAHDQLKLRAGLVRCGACKEIFNGIENLLRPEDLRPASIPAETIPTAQPASASTSPVAVLAPEADGTADSISTPAMPAMDDPLPAESVAATGAEDQPEEEAEAPSTYSDFFEFLTPATQDLPPAPAATMESEADPEAASAETESSPQQAPAEPEAQAVDVPAQDDPLTRMTLIDFRLRDDDDAIDDPRNIGTPHAANLPDPIEQAIDDLQRKPLRRAHGIGAEEERLDASDETAAPEDEAEEPSFVKKARHRQRVGPLITLLMAIGTVLLLAALAAQAAYAFRQELAARFPQAKPVLLRACAAFGCRVGLPSHIDTLTIESNELQTVSPDSATYVFSTLLRNRAATVQAWPNIELTLNDANEKPIARRVFMPREYLANAADVDMGFAAGTEQAIKLYFELAQLKPAGYRVYIFYP
jgi:predicted Zn finger-like uncharacterized protein